MFSSYYLPGLYPFPFRFALFIALFVLVYRCTNKGLQNGVLIGLIVGATGIVLFNGQEIMPGLPNVISVDRIVWPVVLGIFLIKQRRGQIERLPLDWIERVLLAFIAVMFASMIQHGSYVSADGEWSLLFVLRGYGFPFMAYFIARRGAGTGKQFYGFVVALGYFTLYLAFTGLAEIFKIQALVFPQFIMNSAVGIHFGWVRGVFLAATVYGLAVAMALPLLVWLYFNDRAPRRYLWVVTAALLVPCLVYTFQRAAWISAIVAAGVTALAWPKRQLFLMWSLLFLFMCGFWFASERAVRRLEERVHDEGTIESRYQSIERGLVLFRTNPLLGVGMNRFGVESERRWPHATVMTTAHNTWIMILAELGLVGALTYLLPFLFVLFNSFYGYLRFPQHRALLAILVAITLAYLAVSMSIDLRPSLYCNGLLLTLWAMILARLPQRSQKRVVAYRGMLNTGQIRVIRPMMQRRVISERLRSRWP
jgi:O-antigen ligase